MLFCDPDELKWDSIQLEVTYGETLIESFFYGDAFCDEFRQYYLDHELRLIFFLPIDQSMRFTVGRYYMTIKKLAHIEYYQHHTDDGDFIHSLHHNFNHYPKLHLVK